MILHEGAPRGRAGATTTGPARVPAPLRVPRRMALRRRAPARRRRRSAGSPAAPLDLDDPAGRRRGRGGRPLLAAFARADALDRLARAGVPAAPCLGFEELFTDAARPRERLHRSSRASDARRRHPRRPVDRLRATPTGLSPLRAGPRRRRAEVLGEIGYDARRGSPRWSPGGRRPRVRRGARPTSRSRRRCTIRRARSVRDARVGAAALCRRSIAASPSRRARRRRRAVRRCSRAAGIHAGTPAANLRGPLYRLAIRGALASDAGAHPLPRLRSRAALAGRARRASCAAALRVARRHPVLLIGRTEKAHARTTGRSGRPRRS